MSRTTRLILIVTTLVSICGAVSSSAPAVTWHNTGNNIFITTGGPFTLSHGSNNFACSGSTASGNAPALSLDTNYVIPGTMTWSPCTLAGQSTYAHCSFTFTGAGFAAPTTSGSMHLTCTARLTSGNTALCHIEGTTVASYTNPTGFFTAGKLTLPASASLVITHASGTSCLLGTGGGNLTENTMTVSSGVGGSGTRGPIINRTA